MSSLGAAAAGIVSYGGYVPRLRLKRSSIVAANSWMNQGMAAGGKGHRSMANWDEDSITMAVAAARTALTGQAPGSIGGVVLASTTLPFADRLNAGIVSAALDLPEAIDTLDTGSSQRAATSALINALKAMTTGSATLLAAADKRLARPGSTRELAMGDGAAALVLGTNNVIARLIGAHSMARDMVDHYRGEGESFDYALEERWIREEGYLKFVPEAIERLLASTGVPAVAIDHFILPSLMAKIGGAVAKAIGIRPDAVADTLSDECGDTGVAHPLLMLVKTLETVAPGQRILLAGFGQGIDVLLFEVTPVITQLSQRGQFEKLMAGGREETLYTKFLSFNNLLHMDWGIRSERDNRTAQSVAYRKRDAITRFIGGRCRACHTVQFPKTLVCVNPECHAVESQDDLRFADMRGQIKTFTEDWQAFTPSPPLPYANILFSEGGNIFMELTDSPQGSLEIGTPVEMVFRIKDFDERRAFRRYFWKAAPVTPNAPAAVL